MSGTGPCPDDAGVLAMLRACGALLEGHFRLTSGLHSPYYLQCARLFMDPVRTERVALAIKAKLDAAGLGPDPTSGAGFDHVVAPALGGVILGYELARQCSALALFVERDGGRFALRRGFTLAPGTRVLLAEDVVTTGLSSRECMACVQAHGAEVVAGACLVDRSGGKVDLGVPLVALARLELPVYPPDRLPPELAAIPAIKPGSRPAATP